MRKIYTFGETVYDIIFQNDQAVRAVAGGAMLNTAVSLGRMGLPVSLISELGNDQTGRLVKDFLITNGVNAKHIHIYKGRKTAISLAFLDAHKNASYTFYKDYPRNRLDKEFPGINANDIVLFGSFYSLNSNIRKKLIVFLRNAKKKGALIIYDPNLRSPHKDQLKELRPLVVENLSIADVVRASNEDLATLSGSLNIREIRKHIKGVLMITQGEKETRLFTDKKQCTFDVPQAKIESTIGAGDSFNAGLIYAFYREGVNRERLFSGDVPWKEVIDIAHAFASSACGSIENYISKKYAESFRL